MMGFLGFIAVCLLMALVVGILDDGKQKTPISKGGSRISEFSPEEDRFR
jgi:hypothetical protein